MKPAKYRPLLTIENAKTIKGEKLGYLTGILYLAPATRVRRANMCPFATTGCMRDCLFTAGRGVFQEIKKRGSPRPGSYGTLTLCALSVSCRFYMLLKLPKLHNNPIVFTKTSHGITFTQVGGNQSRF